MPHRFCAICGKVIDEFAPHFGMCLNCYLKENPLFELPNNYNFKLCIDCQNYAKKEDWIESENKDLFKIIEAALIRFLLKNYEKQGMIQFSFSFDKLVYSSKDLLTSMDVTILGKLKEDQKISHQHTLKLNINYDLCKNCSNLRAGMYYLSIIQLRVTDKAQFGVIEEALSQISFFVENLFTKDKTQYISKIEDQNLGVDLYLSTNELMNRIISHMRANFTIILNRTKKLVGRDSQKGRGLYRLKALIKFLPFKKNDAVIINNITYLVENISKNKVVLRDENNSKQVKNFSFFFKNKLSLKVIKEAD
ncbi:MAG: NMD3-related protein [Promethearchaeota archaeon]